MAVIKGQAYWAKILGDPAPGYDPTETEWSIDVTVNEDARATLTDLGLADKIKNKGDERGDFITFKRKGVKKDGERAKNITVIDKTRELWPQDELIGNGSEVAVKFIADEWEYGKKKGVRAAVLTVMVLDHVPYGEDELEQFADKSGNLEDDDF